MFSFSHSVGNVIIPTDFHIFQRGRAQPPTRERSSRRVGMGKGKGVASGERSELERSTKSNGKTHKLSTGPFSVAMLNYQRVFFFYCWRCNLYSWI